jgi:hypothetical protein
VLEEHGEHVLLLLFPAQARGVRGMDEAGDALVSLVDLRELRCRSDGKKVIKRPLADASQSLGHLLTMGRGPELQRMLGQTLADPLLEEGEVFGGEGSDGLGHG